MPDDNHQAILEASEIPLGYELVAECGSYPEEAFRLVERLRQKRPACVVRCSSRSYAVWASYHTESWPPLNLHSNP